MAVSWSQPTTQVLHRKYKWLLKLSINNGLDCKSCTWISVISKSATKILFYILNQIVNSCCNTVRLHQSLRVSGSCIKDRLRLKLMKQSNNVSSGDQRKTTAEHVCVCTFVTTLISRNYATLSDIIQLTSAASQLLRQKFSKAMLFLSPMLPLISQQLYHKLTVLLMFFSQTYSSLGLCDFSANRNFCLFTRL